MLYKSIQCKQFVTIGAESTYMHYIPDSFPARTKTASVYSMNIAHSSCKTKIINEHFLVQRIILITVLVLDTTLI